MTTETRSITVSDIEVHIERKDIKNLHLGVYPPNGRVRVAVPLVISDDAVRLAVIGKLGWIRRQQAKFDQQPRQSARQMVNGESHYFLGQRYLLQVHEQHGKQYAALAGANRLHLFVNPNRTIAQREAVLARWYRQQLNDLLPSLLAQWQAVLGVQANAWGIKKMKTRWGSCNTLRQRVWFNLELAKKPFLCLEYVVVHELAHLIEGNHSPRFKALLDRYLPDWQHRKNLLNAQPIGHALW